MSHYKHLEIEKKWQEYWAKNQTFKAADQSSKPKFYALDMFPYPSGAGLHVGHPLGYIASDIVSRYKRHTGFNVLHPMGYDSFGLPAEQYAIQTGQHPAITTQENIARYREQMDRIGFSFDWSREVRTSSPDYYKYTQEIFIMLFDSWYDKSEDRARPISELVVRFRESGTSNINAATDDDLQTFTAAQWNAFTDAEQQKILLDYRLTFLADTEVNWCPALGTVLANDEIVNGVSERGGHPVERKKMRQWMMRISAYAERLLNDLETVDWTESIKEIQRNWIGKSVGALVEFRVQSSELGVTDSQLTAHDSQLEIDVFTTRPDTIYGVTFMTLAPEHELVDIITTPAQKEAVEAYKKATAARSERDRMADVKTISGVFTGAYATHPLSGEPVPVWIGDYVLAGYGTGAVMAVPCGDERDHAFANHFAGQEGMPAIKNIFEGVDISEQAYTAKDNTPLCNSDFLNGMSYKEAMAAAIAKLEERGAGKGKTNYRLRDAVFSRQRYWGEPIPVYFKDGLPQMIDKKHLPLELPEVDEYLPTQDGAPPLGRATKWFWDVKNNCVVENLIPAFSSGEGAFDLPSANLEDNAANLFGEETNLEDNVVNAGGGNYYNMASPELQQKLTFLARQNRKNPTKTEDILWQQLRNRKLNEAKFRRQHPIDRFIVDFACLDKKLVVEVDGGIHADQQEADQLRTNILEIEYGFKVIRFTNEEVTHELTKVLTTISDFLEARLSIKVSKSQGAFSPTEERKSSLSRDAKSQEAFSPTEESKSSFSRVAKSQEAFSPTEKRKSSLSPLEKGLGIEAYPLELNTMPGWAGSSWYMYRYMDANNENEMFSDDAQKYWQNVDLYIGGSEHATGHLLYSRFWIKFLHDMGKVSVKEPFQKMINQGMILGESAFVHRIGLQFMATVKTNLGGSAHGVSEFDKDLLEALNEKVRILSPYLSLATFKEIKENKYDFKALTPTLKKLLSYESFNIQEEFEKFSSEVTVELHPLLGIQTYKKHVDVSFVNTYDELDINRLNKDIQEYKDAIFHTEEDGTFKVSREVEKMSKSKYNVVNPDDICEQYGADTLRLYEMFLGPLEQAKPWSTAGITGVYGFMKKLWRLYHDDNGFNVSDDKASPESMKTLHKTIKKTREDIENFSFNTSVSSFMIAVNELTAQKCNNREVLEPLAILVSPYAPHIAEELWSLLGHKESISEAAFPVFEAKYLVESSKTYPISFNGKMKFTLDFPADLSKEELEKQVLANEKVQEQLAGKEIKKAIIIPGKIVNFVIG